MTYFIDAKLLIMSYYDMMLVTDVCMFDLFENGSFYDGPVMIHLIFSSYVEQQGDHRRTSR